MIKLRSIFCLFMAVLGLALEASATEIIEFSRIAPGALGLKGGYITTYDANTFHTATIPANQVYSSLFAAENSSTATGGAWGNNRTWIYTGYMYFKAGKHWFLETIDDAAYVKIDGVEILKCTIYNSYMNRSVVIDEEGWHQVEFRFGNGMGSAGPNGSSKSKNGALLCGLGFIRAETSPGNTVAAMANYYLPRNNDATLIAAGYCDPYHNALFCTELVDEVYSFAIDTAKAGASTYVLTVKSQSNTKAKMRIYLGRDNTVSSDKYDVAPLEFSFPQDGETQRSTFHWPYSEVPYYRVEIVDVELNENVYQCSNEASDIEDKAYYRLGNDRILLMNDDAAPGREVIGQAYSNTTVGAVTGWWTHNTLSPGTSESQKARFPGTNHYFRVQRDGVNVTLWALDGALAGSLYYKTIPISNNYLPAGPTAIKSSISWRVGTRAYYATNDNCEVILLNVPVAQVRSSVLDGIGAIHFDAVNSANLQRNQAIAVDIATNTVSGAELDNTTNVDDYKWETASIKAWMVKNSNEFEEVEDVGTQLTLASNAGGTKSYYHVKCDLQYTGKIAFRIRRVAIVSGSYNDAANLIDLDNIIATYPVKGIALKEFGEYNADLVGKAVLGFSPAFNVAFPAAGQEGVKGRVGAEVVGAEIRIPEYEGASDNPVLTSVEMEYRWRYLNQVFNPVDKSWLKLAMLPTDESRMVWESSSDLDLSAGVGDIEYRWKAEVSAPYYSYYDYSGLSLPSSKYPGGWESWCDMVTGTVHKASFDPSLSASGGNDFFVRLREGASQYEQLKLVGSKRIPDPENPGEMMTVCFTNQMELAGDHLWRGFVSTRTNEIGTLRFAVTGFNRTEDGALALAENETRWVASVESIAGSDLPYSGLMVETSEPADMTSVPMDASQSYMMFEFNDELLSIALTRADYQNFNLWTQNPTDKFMGDNVETNGVSREKKGYAQNFRDEMLSSLTATNRYWEEHFALDSTQIASSKFNYTNFVQAGLSPNGWTVGQAMYVAEEYSNKGLALKLYGQGLGSIAMQDLAYPMNGLDHVNFKARISQDLTLGSFTTYLGISDDVAVNGITAPQSWTNYGVAARVAMDDNSGANLSPAVPSLSMVGYYKEKKGCYEFRVSRDSTPTGNSNNPTYKECFYLELYKWTSSGTGLPQLLARSKPKKFDTNESNHIADFLKVSNPTNRYAMYFTLNTTSSGAVELTGYISTGKASKVNVRLDDTAFSTYEKITFTDSDSPLKGGTCGFASTDCLGDFFRPEIYPLNAAKDNIAFSNGVTFSLSCNEENRNELWAIPNGRSEFYYNRNNKNEQDAAGYILDYGIRGVIEPQQLSVYTAKVPSSNGNGSSDRNYVWEELGDKIAVSSFKDQSFSIPFEKIDNYYVRLQTVGEPDNNKVRTDVVVDDLVLSSWRGNDTEKVGDEQAGGSYTDERWVWTEGWITQAYNSTDRKNYPALLMSPRRASPYYPLSIRSPLINGMAMFTFSWTNANAGVVLKLQRATTNSDNSPILKSDVLTLTRRHGNETAVSLPAGVSGDSRWVDIATYRFDGSAGAFPKTGSHTEFIGLRAPVRGLLRLVMSPRIVTDSHSADTATADANKVKEITITSVSVFDEPELDAYSWWGWNMMSTRDDRFLYLPDPAEVPPGMSGALNNSLSADVHITNPQTDYRYHNPFIQSPLATNGIGKISFKARKFNYTDPAAENPEVTILASLTDGNATDGQWRVVTNIVVDSVSWKTYEWATPKDTSEFKAIRFMVDGVANTLLAPEQGEHAFTSPQRVLLEEVVVAEPVAPTITFVNVRPFRTNLADDPAQAIPDITSPDQQPIIGEGFGIQAEVKVQQLSNELDFDSIHVYMAYYEGEDVWGYENWKKKVNKIHISELERVPGEDLIFRSSYNFPDSIIVPEVEKSEGKPYLVVQYHVWASYGRLGENETESLTHELTAREWSNPAWYWPIDLNTTHGADGEFSAYTILDTVSPYRVWVNEFNYFDGLKNGYESIAETNQFIELAAPSGVDLTDWTINLYETDHEKKAMAVMGAGDIVSRKTVGSTNHYSFICLQSPLTTAAKGKADGTWSRTIPREYSGAEGSLSFMKPHGVEIVRPSGVVEHQVVIHGTNLYSNASWGCIYDGTNLVAELRKLQPGSKWCYAGGDNTAGTVGVMTGHGDRDEDWEENLKPTPGLVNQRWDSTLQFLDPLYYAPATGTNKWIYSTVLSDKLTQVCGTRTGSTMIIIVPHGSSTNITFKAAPWWRISSVDVDNVQAKMSDGTLVKDNDLAEWTLTIENVTNTVNVLADAAVAKSISAPESGLAPDSPYFDAVIDWLSKFTEGEDTDAEIKYAKYYDLSRSRSRPLTLLEMYWLDINPIEDDWSLVGGIKPIDMNVPCRKEVSSGEDIWVSNKRLEVFMMISNETTRVAFPPSKLQGRDGRSSEDYYALGADSWHDTTFKVMATLWLREASSLTLSKYWIPLKTFVFHPDSFGAPGAANAFTATIDLWDPFDSWSPAYAHGWYNYKDTNEMYFNWVIDDTSLPDTVEVLKQDSTNAP